MCLKAAEVRHGAPEAPRCIPEVVSNLFQGVIQRPRWSRVRDGGSEQARVSPQAAPGAAGTR